MEKEIQDTMVQMKLRSLVTLVGAAVLITNSFNIIYSKVLRNEEERAYERERADRKFKNERERDAFILRIHTLEEQVRERDKEIKNNK